MKIAVFSDTFFPKTDGIVTSTLNFAQRLSNHEFTVFSPAYREKSDPDIKGMTCHRFFSVPLISYTEIKIVIPNLYRLFRLLRRNRPDIIHINTPGPMGLLGIICSKIYRIPCVGTYHTLVSEQLMYLSIAKLLRIGRFFKKKKKETLLEKLVWKGSVAMYNRCDLVIAPSKSIENVLKEHGIKKETKVISNGIDRGLFKPKREYNKKVSRLVHVGRISYEKNIDQTIRAFALTLKKHPSATYTIIGDGPALRSLKDLARELKLDIRFLGYVPYKNLPGYYKNEDVFITASTMETQGLVILEAMASGLPVIGVRSYAIPDIVKNNHNGFLVRPGDIEGMSECFNRLIENPGLVSELGQNAARFVIHHDLNSTAALLERTYKRTVRNKSN
ncbi:MAG: glycosyltransferase [Phycisphaerae bacterium]|jgi:glycosyltransferase involved in cell wall biosynthesis|nr:glycosyltransferase [Phycisphaerae bacterium]